MISIKLNPKSIKTHSSTGRIYFSYADIEQLPEWPEGPLLEIIGGELYLVPSPSIIHHDISAELQLIIRQYLKDNPKIGRLFNAPVDVKLSDEDVVIPDLFFIKTINTTIITEKNIQGVPDWVIEILSINQERDLITKKELYEKYSVKEYWIIDPTNETVIVYLLEGKRFAKPKKYSKSMSIAANVVKGLTISLQAIFNRNK